MPVQVFWRAKKLHEMSPAEFESLCDGCGKCCLHKLEDEDTGDVYYTKVACRFLDHDTCKCQVYAERQKHVPDCITLTPESVKDTYWLPETCAYRLIDEGIPLFDWHPLISGDPDSVHKAGMSVAGQVVHENSVNPDDLEDHIVRWV
ncbi:UPF0260 protein [Cellvibrio zantedeschiae]|uniref:UPF0260 protein GCM10011613_06770 n=1 Tax=Cellvibrio zantedeschiae TaxID=1237077 RepID=A0ABQ3AVM3_9GAMM|nr:YcgN family cysteine cluster protein [Cellvibrio zantedeschiae]GGY65550.1 UPF0260 protein [Cellvibrio zantedeschiae]